MGQVLFIVWRECVEALLVIGILHAWLSHGMTANRRGLAYLWCGVLAGVVAALVLALTLSQFSAMLSGDAQTYFQIVMLLVAAVLIVHMVVWMHRHGRTLKQQMRAAVTRSDASGQWWGVFVLAMLAVAREGSEMAIFLYGICVSQQISLPTMLLSGCIGLAMAYATFYLLQLGGKIFSWQLFFNVTEIILLLLAASLVLNGVERLLDLSLENSDVLLTSDFFMALTLPVWDTSQWVSDSSAWGNLLATLIGYRARPTWCNVFTLVVYWMVIALVMLRMHASDQKSTS